MPVFLLADLKVIDDAWIPDYSGQGERERGKQSDPRILAIVMDWLLTTHPVIFPTWIGTGRHLISDFQSPNEREGMLWITMF